MGKTTIAYLAAISLLLLVFSGQASLPGSPDTMPDGFVLVPGGKFIMGSSAQDAYEDEGPTREVTLSPFLMAAKEVGQEEFLGLMGYNPSFFKGAGLPVESVSWFDACAYCNALSAKEGLSPAYRIDAIERGLSGSIRHAEVSMIPGAKGYRLPTEAEWEWAAQGARAQGEAGFAGSGPIRDLAWFVGNSGSRSHLTGRKAPNDLGMYDLSGNVTEWCWDWYGSYEGAENADPQGPAEGREKVIRGGSWQDAASSLRVKSRASRHPDFFGPTIGFRPMLPFSSLESWTEASKKGRASREPEASSLPSPEALAAPMISPAPSGEPISSEGGAAPQGLKALLALALSIRDEASLLRFEEAIDALDKEGLDELQSLLETEAERAKAEGRAEPGLRLALSATYGRKGLSAKAYEQILAAEEEAKAPGLSFSMGVLYGRKALLSFAAPEQAPTPSPPLAPSPTPSATQAIDPSSSSETLPSEPSRLEFSPHMVYVAGGSFMMGNTGEGEPGESIVHAVTVSPFFISSTEITQKTFKSIMGFNPSKFEGDNRPVENVTWFDAVFFCNLLSETIGETPFYSISQVMYSGPHIISAVVHVPNWAATGYRLPTDAEWEFAARGGHPTQEAEYSGSNTADEVAWTGANSGGETKAVASKKPNSIGLYDMSGNVFEWCWDWLSLDTTEIDPRGPEIGYVKVDRGGAWAWENDAARVFDKRHNRPPSYRDDVIGFRIARSSTKNMEMLLAPPSLKQEPKTATIPQLMSLPGGSFTMGDTAGGGAADEKPLHDVRVSPFAIGTHEVTREEFMSVMGYDPIKGGDPTLPVTKVSWYDAVGYCVALSYREGLEPYYWLTEVQYDGRSIVKAKVVEKSGANGYRLPTEAEWEYAAKDGTLKQTLAWPGSGNSDEVAWLSTNSPPLLARPVCQKAPNEFSLYDIAGNAAEWCSDWYGAYSATTSADPKGPASGSRKIVRGGSFDSAPIEARSSARNGRAPEERRVDTGFRVARSYPSSSSVAIPLAATPLREFALIPSGTFAMGDTAGGGEADERPTHEVKLASFELGRTELSVQAFAAFVEATGYISSAEMRGRSSVYENGEWIDMVDASWRKPGFDQSGEEPVVCVSWYDAVAYCNWRSASEGFAPLYSYEGYGTDFAQWPTGWNTTTHGKITCDYSGFGYRLPTEAEWEYAAKGGVARQANAFSGSKIALEVAWHADGGLKRTSPTAIKKRNELGLHDMSGNVNEWCDDWYAAYASGSVTDPRGPTTGLYKVMRGGGWAQPTAFQRVSDRSSLRPWNSSSMDGFRVARVAAISSIYYGSIKYRASQVTPTMLMKAAKELVSSDPRFIQCLYRSGGKDMATIDFCYLDVVDAGMRLDAYFIDIFSKKLQTSAQAIIKVKNKPYVIFLKRGFIESSPFAGTITYSFYYDVEPLVRNVSAMLKSTNFEYSLLAFRYFGNNLEISFSCSKIPQLSIEDSIQKIAALCQEAFESTFPFTLGRFEIKDIDIDMNASP